MDPFFPKRKTMSNNYYADAYSESQQAGILFENVTFGYSKGEPLFDVFNWRSPRGVAWSILGRSGCGKTTLLYLLSGLRKPTDGAIYINGHPINGPNLAAGLVLQDFGLLNWYTVFQNTELGMKIRGVCRDKRHHIAKSWLSRMGIEHLANRYPSQLSGGERQRVALARVLALGSNLLLLDEPFASIDEMRRENLQQLLWELKQELNTTMVLVTHSVEEAVLLSDKILIFTSSAPIHTYTILDSPFANGIADRDNPEFAAFCAGIRKRLNV